MRRLNGVGVSYVKVELLNQQQQKTMTGVRSRMKISKPVTFSLPSYDPRLPRKGLPLLPSCSFSFWIYRRQHSQEYSRFPYYCPCFSFWTCLQLHNPEGQLLPAAAAAQAVAAQTCWFRLLMAVLHQHNHH